MAIEVLKLGYVDNKPKQTIKQKIKNMLLNGKQDKTIANKLNTSVLYVQEVKREIKNRNN